MELMKSLPSRSATRRRRGSSTKTISALILREVATAYGRTPGGYIWAFMEPIAGIVLLTAVFSIGFHAPPLGISFALFYATGILPFLMFMHLSGKISQSINFSKPLLAYPSVSWIDAIIARFLLNSATEAVVGMTVLTGIMILLRNHAIVSYDYIFQAYFFTALLGLSIGIMNCFLQGIFAIWAQVWSIIMRPMFLVSGIFFTFESVPRNLQEWLWFNPIIHIIGIMRRGFYPYYAAEYTSPAYLSGVSLTILATGIFLMRAHHRKLIQY